MCAEFMYAEWGNVFNKSELAEYPMCNRDILLTPFNYRFSAERWFSKSDKSEVFPPGGSPRTISFRKPEGTVPREIA